MVCRAEALIAVGPVTTVHARMRAGSPCRVASKVEAATRGLGPCREGRGWLPSRTEPLAVPSVLLLA
jgi:hypothetical protein